MLSPLWPGEFQLADLRLLDDSIREAMRAVIMTLDSMTGGSFKRGWREPTSLERIAEWDALQPPQIEQLKQTKGEEWWFSQGAAIEKLRRQVDIGAH